MIRHVVTACLLLLISGASALETNGTVVRNGIPPADANIREELRPFLSARGARFLDWIDDESILLRTRFGSTWQLHEVKAPRGARTQLTFYDEPVAIARSRGGQTVFLKDSGGDEQYQVYLLGTPLAISAAGSRHDRPLLSATGNRLAYMGNGRNGIHWDVYLADGKSSWQPQRIVESERGYWYPLDFSADENRLLLQQYLSINESYLFIYDIAQDSLEPVLLSDSPTGIAAARFDRFQSGLLVITDVGSQYRQLLRVSASGTRLEAFSDYLPYDIDRFAQTSDGSRLAFVINQGGLNRVAMIDRKNGLELDVPNLPVGVIDHLAFSPDDTRLALSLQGAITPGDVFVLTSGNWVQWTASEVGGIDRSRWVEPEIFHFPAADKLEIPAFIYKPSAPGPHPVLIDIHGGPEGQYRPWFRADIQYFVTELGIAVIAPNVRGSSGYGKDYLLMDNGLGRMGSVRDIGSLLDWVSAQNYLDDKRVAVTGRSYGGFMVLASLVEYSDRLVAGIDTVGISNFVTFLENTSPYRRNQRRAEYGDERDPKMREFLTRISPLTNAKQISAPLFVIQGANDPRVPQSESEQMVARIRENGGEVWYLLFTNEGHGIRKKENQATYYEAVVSFLRENLVK